MQVSVLGPLLFVIYTADVVNTVKQQGLSANQYADDIQGYSWLQGYSRQTTVPRPWRLHRTGRQLDGHEPSSSERHKNRIHIVHSTMSPPSVSVRSTCSWLCSGDTSRLSMRPRHLPGQQNVSEVERYQARVHVLWRPSTDTQHQTIGSMVNTVDAHLQLRRV